MGWRITKAPITWEDWKIRNIAEYDGVQPSQELVYKVFKKSKTKYMCRFEIAFGLPIDTLKKYLNGTRATIPPKFWHIFYDFDKLKDLYRRYEQKQRHIKEYVAPKKNVAEANRQRLEELKNKFNGEK